MKFLKKLSFWLGLVASVLIVGSTLKGFLPEKLTNTEDVQPEASIVHVIEE